jgi:hypothetical protein
VSSFLAHNTYCFSFLSLWITVLYYAGETTHLSFPPSSSPERNDILVGSQMYSFIHGFYVSLVFSELNSLVGMYVVSNLVESEILTFHHACSHGS